MYPASLSGALAGAVTPPGLIIELPEAWALILTVLAVCCSFLWFLTRSIAPDERAPDAPRSRRTHAGSQTRRPALHPLAHHGSRAA